MEGLPLKQHGTRWWTCCPLHGERTASMVFFPDGGWKCFGCNVGGDAVSLYGALHGLTPYESARTLAGQFGLVSVMQRQTTERELARQAKRQRQEKITKYRQASKDEWMIVETLDFLGAECWGFPEWVQALENATCADIIAQNLRAEE